MSWLIDMLRGGAGAQPIPIAGSVLILALVAAAGLALGSIRFRGVGLGIAGVLFAGLLAGHLGRPEGLNIHFDHAVLEFLREFGLILFVYTIGVQVGPGFFASFRRAGLALNTMAAAVVVLGVVVTLGVFWLGGVPMPAAVGLFSGATTNTPSLAAAQQALKDLPAADARAIELPGLGYAVAYPFGIVGIILTMLLVRWLFRIDPRQEEQEFQAAMAGQTPAVERANLEVTNPNLVGLPLQDVPLAGQGGVVISRILQDGELAVPQPETRLKLGDVLLAVGPRKALDQLRLVVGRETTVDLRTLPGGITTRRIIVTIRSALGKSLDELDFVRRFGVRITRVSRAEIEMAAAPGFQLQYGDTVLAVGEPDGIAKVAAELGDSPKSLNYPQLIPLFVGLALGVVVGSWPIHLPGVPVPVRLGLAGGPLLVAMVLARLGRIGSLVWYMPISANFMLREVGIVLFLACVGIMAGGRFVEVLVGGQGLYWLGLGALITLLPLLTVAIFARLFRRLNYLLLCGMLAGSMTDPPALAFANHAAGSEGPSVAYATVYPLAMILRVLAAQAMVLLALS